MKKLLLAIVMMLLFVGNSFAGYVVVANKDFPVDKISGDDLKMIFLCQKSEVGGKKIVPFILDEGMECHKSFCVDIIKKNVSQWGAHFRNLIFTGKGSPPKSFGDCKGLLEAIASTSCAIGYAEKADNSVKVITVE